MKYAALSIIALLVMITALTIAPIASAGRTCVDPYTLIVVTLPGNIHTYQVEPNYGQAKKDLPAVEAQYPDAVSIEIVQGCRL
jgi:uncharacterized membrane protein